MPGPFFYLIYCLAPRLPTAPAARCNSLLLGWLAPPGGAAEPEWAQQSAYVSGRTRKGMISSTNLTFDSYMIPEEDLELGQSRLLEVDNSFDSNGWIYYYLVH